MCDPIHQSSGQHRISKELDPFGELQVRIPKAIERWVLPIPGLPIQMMFS
jgi:hypothetical protein